MADTRISLLSAASTLGGTEEFPGVQSAATKKVTANQIKTFVNAGGLAGLLAVSNITGAYNIRLSGHTASRVAVLDANKDLVSSSVTNTELGYISGLTSGAQSQLDKILNGTSIHTLLKVNGKSFFGANDTPTAHVHIAASTTAEASLRIRAGVAPSAPNDGDIWFDGTDFKARVGGTTYTIQLV